MNLQIPVKKHIHSLYDHRRLKLSHFQYKLKRHGPLTPCIIGYASINKMPMQVCIIEFGVVIP